jgi:hypothetical protein
MRGGLRLQRALGFLAVAAVAVATGSVAAASGAANTNLVTDTVYDGTFAVSQTAAGWNDAEFQFSVSAGGRLVFDEIGPECGPTDAFAPTPADVHGDQFSSETSFAGAHYSVTLTGRFDTGGKAKGSGLLVTETIQGEPCRETDDWTAQALPKGTLLCPAVDPGLATYTTATGMSCDKAGLAFAAGVRELRKSDPSGESTKDFESPGFDCTGPPDGDPIVSAVCTRGTESFRLPAG